MGTTSVSMVVMAAGSSTRFSGTGGSGKPSMKKQWIRIDDMPLWLFVTKSLFSAFARLRLDNVFIDRVYITSSVEDLPFMTKYAPRFVTCVDPSGNEVKCGVEVVCGGLSRYASVMNVAKHAKSDFICVNDCARFNIDHRVVERVIRTLDSDTSIDCVCPVLPAVDGVLHVDSDRIVYPDRNVVRLIRTPQISRRAKFLETAKLGMDFFDDSSALHALGAKVSLVDGGTFNSMTKLTFPSDLEGVSFRNTDVLIGFGSDIHSFQEGRRMRLCGVDLDSNVGFRAHSDGDVALHALIDALLGASALGDIGEMFPDSDNDFMDIDSNLLLKRVYDTILSLGLEIVNLDITITAQVPRISAYKQRMRENLADILYLDNHRVNIKATTPEHLGFVGRKEGVLAQAVVSLKAREVQLKGSL